MVKGGIKMKDQAIDNKELILALEVYKNEWEIRYSGDGLRTVQEYKEAADES